MFQVMGVFAEFERAMIRERVRMRASARASQSARAEDTWPPRSALTPTAERAVRELLANGMGIVKAAKAVGIGTGTAAKIKAELAG